MAAKRKRLSWQAKLPLLLVFFATAPVAFLAFWTFDLLTVTWEQSTLDSLGALARAKSEAIDQFTEDRKSEVERIAQLIAPRVDKALDAEAEVGRQGDGPETPPEPLPQLQDAEALVPGEPPQVTPPPRPEPPPAEATGARPPRGGEGPARALEEAMAELRQTLGLILWDQARFEELLVVDAEGRVLASTFAAHEGKTAADLEYFRSGMGTTYVQPVFMSPITERLTMVIATPIRDDTSQVIGILAARLNLSRFFRLINDRTGLGSTGETIVGKVFGSEILFMAPTRHDPEAALTRKVQLGSGQGGQTLQDAARGGSGSGQVSDYRDECTYAAWEHVPSLAWGLAVKMDCTEAVEPVDRARDRLTIFALGVLALALLAAFVAARTLVRPLQQLKEAADRISKGNVDVSLDIRSGDELGELADSFERMVAAIKFFREHPARTPEEERALEEAEARAEAEAFAQREAAEEEEPRG